jgi:DNA invertase Pin-like site-specific DNA recombinase
MNTRHTTPADLAGLRWRGYVRESTQRQAEAWSPERQRQDILRAATELGLVAAESPWYERTGTGEAVSDELDAALQDGKAGQYDVLLVLTTSRFARNRVEAGRRKEQFAKAGVPIYFVQDRIVSGARSSRLLEGVREVIDEEENEQRRFWVAGGLRQRQVSGRWVGVIPVGYRRALVDFPDGTRGWDGALEHDPVYAAIVRRIYDEAAAGAGVRRVATSLNADGLRTNNGRLWSPGIVHDILVNRVYIGHLIRYRRTPTTAYYGATSEDGQADLGLHIPAIIDETLWEQVQETMAGRRTPGGARSGRTYPLSRVLRCASCGYRMTGVHNSVTRYYRCAGRTRFHLCDAVAIRADVAEDQFARWIGSYRLPDDWRTAVARTSLDRVKVDERDRRAGADERLKRLRDLYSWGDIAEDEYRRQTSEIRAAITVVRPGLAGLEAVAEALRDLGPAWRAADPDVQAAVPPLMLKSASVSKGRVSEWVVRAELRPLLELCVPGAGSPWSRAQDYTVRFSA